MQVHECMHAHTHSHTYTCNYLYADLNHFTENPKYYKLCKMCEILFSKDTKISI